jgi:phosphatidate cytidylyltransferase
METPEERRARERAERRAHRAERERREAARARPEPESESEPEAEVPDPAPVVRVPAGRRGADPTTRPAARPPARRRPDPAAPRRRRAGSDVLGRVLVAVPAAFVAIIFVDVGGIAFAVLMALAAVLCLIELYRMLHRWRPAGWVGYVAAVALVAAARYGSDRTVLEIALASLPVTFLAVAVETRDNMPTVSIAGTLLGIVWIGLGFAHGELLRELPHGNSIVIDVMVGTFLADVGAFFGGRMFGRRPLAPAISPNKTVEGLGLGMLTAVVTVFVAGRFQQTWLTEGDSLLLGLAIAVLGPIGDLFESVVKRDAGVKDSGTLFGAHGGALDRLDAILFTVVGGYYVWVGLLH